VCPRFFARLYQQLYYRLVSKPVAAAGNEPSLSSSDCSGLGGARKNQKNNSESARRTTLVRRMYGLRVTSSLPLPDVDAKGPVLGKVEIREGSSADFSKAMRETAKRPPGSSFSYDLCLSDGSIYSRWEGLFDFLISSDGRRIAARAMGNTSGEVMQTYLLGQVLSFALLKLGIETLHATTIVVKNRAIAFMGDTGFGKSSLGAAFLQAGYPLLTDDLLVLKSQGRSYLAYPGVPRIKLFPENLKNTLGPGISGTPMNNLTRKLIISLKEMHAHDTAVPLKAIYALASPAACAKRLTIQIRRLSPRRAFVELTRNTFNSVVRDADRLQRHFRHMSALARRVPVSRISYPRKLELLPAVRDAILADLSG
jgi:hypothetical protein